MIEISLQNRYIFYFTCVSRLGGFWWEVATKCDTNRFRYLPCGESKCWLMEFQAPVFSWSRTLNSRRIGRFCEILSAFYITSSVKMWLGIRNNQRTLASNLYHFVVNNVLVDHDDVIKWNPFPRYWPFVRGIHRSRWIPHTKASDAELWCFLWSLSKQPWGWWFETPPWSLWRHRNMTNWGVLVNVKPGPKGEIALVHSHRWIWKRWRATAYYGKSKFALIRMT